jgi:hypothetical protein
VAADTGWGIWERNDPNYTYTYHFKANNELKLWYTGGQGKEGAWYYQQNTCWSGYEKNRQYGNVMVYVDSLQCCLLANFLGNKLVLSEVWQKGTDDYQICNNNVLTSIKENPDQRAQREQREIRSQQAREEREARLAQQLRDEALRKVIEQDSKSCPEVVKKYKEIKKTRLDAVWIGCSGSYEEQANPTSGMSEERYVVLVQREIAKLTPTARAQMEKDYKICPEVVASYFEQNNKDKIARIWMGCLAVYR